MGNMGINTSTDMQEMWLASPEPKQTLNSQAQSENLFIQTNSNSSSYPPNYALLFTCSAEPDGNIITCGSQVSRLGGHQCFRWHDKVEISPSGVCPHRGRRSGAGLRRERIRY